MSTTMITFTDLQRLMYEWHAEIPVVYYGMTDAVERGQVYEVHPLYNDPFLVLHPDDVQELRLTFPNLRFVNLRVKTDDVWRAKQGGQP